MPKGRHQREGRQKPQINPQADRGRHSPKFRSKPMRRQFAAIAFLIAGANASALWAVDSSNKTQSMPIGQGDVIPKQWLDRAISTEQAEAQNLVDGVPFGAESGSWQSLKDSLQSGDSLWTYCSPLESFKALAGRCGIAVVRDGRVVMQLVTIMN
jgi:hypothetical protein